MTAADDDIGDWSCVRCGRWLGAGALACPHCGQLVHAAELTRLADLARAAEANGDVTAALTAWREALDLLPAGTRQRDVIAARITALVRGRTGPAGGRPRSLGSRAAGVAGTVGLALWKLKAVLFGLTKATTLLSMVVSFGFYWTIFGWPLALGLVLSIYVHEMGHVIALRKYGFKATAPMFIPGLGALIRLKQQVVNPLEDAEIGLAGPVYGLVAAVASLGLWYATGRPVLAVVAGLGAWINLFNLLPVWTLDGGRAFHALSRVQRFAGAAAAGAAWYYTGGYPAGDGLLALVAVVCLYRAVATPADPRGSLRSAATYVGLIAALTAVSRAQNVVRRPPAPAVATRPADDRDDDDDQPATPATTPPPQQRPPPPRPIGSSAVRTAR